MILNSPVRGNLGFLGRSPPDAAGERYAVVGESEISAVVE